MLPREDRIRIELPIADLLHLAALADLGFKRMMPNDRGIETLPFDDEEQARDAARSIERLELSIPDTHKPIGHSASRQAMIRHWWPLECKRAWGCSSIWRGVGDERQAGWPATPKPVKTI
jgi:hypothetical protein